MQKQRTYLMLLGVCAAVFALCPFARAEESIEAKVKAAFLANFTQFVEWPERAFASPDAPLVVGVLGASPFGDNLDRAMAGRSAGKRRIEVKRFKTAAEAAGAHILYISNSERERLPKILEELNGKPILTVGDSENFIPLGGIIRFVLRDERVQLDVNPEPAQRNEVRISAKLLRLSNIITVRKR